MVWQMAGLDCGPALKVLNIHVFLPRGWSAGAVWGGRRAVVVGGLTGSDESPVRMMDIWVGEIEN